jgi:hypothetical protein
VRWAVKGVIPEQGVGFFYGASQAFKSFITLDYALHRAYGMKWLGRKTKQAVPVYLAAEGGAGLMRRIEAWHQARGMDWRKCPMRVVIVALTCAPRPRRCARRSSHRRRARRRDRRHDEPDLHRRREQQRRGGRLPARPGHRAARRPGLHRLRSCTTPARPATPARRQRHVQQHRLRAGVERDGKEMLATIDFPKTKDAERPDAQTFELSVQQLGKDEDGDPSPRWPRATSTTPSELVEAHKREGAAGRGGRNMLLVGLLHNGMTERELRKAFYDASEITELEARKKAFYRSRDWALKEIS